MCVSERGSFWNSSPWHKQEQTHPTTIIYTQTLNYYITKLYWAVRNYSHQSSLTKQQNHDCQRSNLNFKPQAINYKKWARLKRKEMHAVLDGDVPCKVQHRKTQELRLGKLPHSVWRRRVLSEEEVGVNGSEPCRFVGEELNLWAPLLHWLKHMTSVVEYGGSWALSFSWTQTRNILLLHYILRAFRLDVRTTFSLRVQRQGVILATALCFCPKYWKTCWRQKHTIVLYFETAHHQFYTRNTCGIINP
jgi:hypothetical protein